ncbi:hypothetical protein QUA00_01125 [Microcoleus sp. T2B6]
MALTTLIIAFTKLPDSGIPRSQQIIFLKYFISNSPFFTVPIALAIEFS